MRVFSRVSDLFVWLFCVGVSFVGLLQTLPGSVVRRLATAAVVPLARTATAAATPFHQRHGGPSIDERLRRVHIAGGQRLQRDRTGHRTTARLCERRSSGIVVGAEPRTHARNTRNTYEYGFGGFVVGVSGFTCVYMYVFGSFVCGSGSGRGGLDLDTTTLLGEWSYYLFVHVV